MKLTNIDIINFGQFSDESFSLPDGDLAVFFGKNEAGKSTLVAFIKQILFGFPTRKNSGLYFEQYTPLSKKTPLGGSLTFQDGDDTYVLSRLYKNGDLKKGKATVKLNGDEVPESVFFDRIQNIDGDFYADSFMFNQELLSKISSLTEKDLLEHIYYLGAANSSEFLSLRDEFSKNAQAIFKQKGKNPPLNRVLSQMEVESEKLAELEAKLPEYNQMASRKVGITAELTKANSQLASEQKSLQELEHLVELRPTYLQLQDLKKQYQPMKIDLSDYHQSEQLTADLAKLQSEIAQMGEISESEILYNETDVNQVLSQRLKLLQSQSQVENNQRRVHLLEEQNAQLLNLDGQVQSLAKLSDEELADFKDRFGKATEKMPEIKLPKLALVLMILSIVAAVPLGMFVMPALYGIAGFAVIFAIVWAVQLKKRSNALREAHDRIDQAKQDFTDSYGFEAEDGQLDHLLEQTLKFQHNSQEMAQLKEQTKEIYQELSQITSQVATVSKRNVGLDFRSVLKSIDDLEKNFRIYQKEHAQKIADLHRLKQLQSEQKAKAATLTAIWTKYQQADQASFKAYYERALKMSELKTKIATIEQNLGANLAKLEKETEFDSQIAEYQAKIAKSRQTISGYQEALAELQVKLEKFASSDDIAIQKQAVANQEDEARNLAKEYLANQLVNRWVSRYLDLASDERFPKMLKLSQTYFSLLTGHRYTGFKLADNIICQKADGSELEVAYLSRGTKEQLYFALKLAFVVLIREQVALPILIDDSFVNFDQERVSYIKELLDKISQEQQVIIFTAQAELLPISVNLEEKD
ncbi:MAG: AAA family ATPase [Lactobacillus sp.]|nr:AAA family ATPase [Lactobacillus sp.]